MTQTAASVVAILLALAFLVTGVAKVAAVPAMRESANRLGLPLNAYRGIGALEVAGVLGLCIGFSDKSVGVAAGMGLFS